MDNSWKEYVKSYLEKLNQTYLDGKLERLVAYFTDDTAITKEIARWSRDREQTVQRGIQPLVSKIEAIPLSNDVGEENSIEIKLLIHQQMYYRQGNQTFKEENRRLQTVQLKPDKYGWGFIRPWGWYLNKEDTPVNADGKNELADNKNELADNKNELADNKNEQTADDATEAAIVTAQRRLHYSRTKAVEYAETYWNHPNPAFKTFEVDCTNFVSQCLYAGGIPMIFSNNRGSGWWYKGTNWSYSWAVANSLYLLLKSGKAPFYTKQVPDPAQLQIGDVICYDFDGDGHWQHNTFVVAKDANGMPLVNARTTDSRHRYWEYRDSSAYTPKIRYAFFHIYGRHLD